MSNYAHNIPGFCKRTLAVTVLGGGEGDDWMMAVLRDSGTPLFNNNSSTFLFYIFEFDWYLFEKIIPKCKIRKLISLGIVEICFLCLLCHFSSYVVRIGGKMSWRLSTPRQVIPWASLPGNTHKRKNSKNSTSSLAWVLIFHSLWTFINSYNS